MVVVVSLCRLTLPINSKMDYENYIEISPIPPFDSEEGYEGDGTSILQKMNKEVIRIYVTLRI